MNTAAVNPNFVSQLQSFFKQHQVVVIVATAAIAEVGATFLLVLAGLSWPAAIVITLPVVCLAAAFTCMLFFDEITAAPEPEPRESLEEMSERVAREHRIKKDAEFRSTTGRYKESFLKIQKISQQNKGIAQEIARLENQISNLNSSELGELERKKAILKAREAKMPEMTFGTEDRFKNALISYLWAVPTKERQGILDDLRTDKDFEFLPSSISDLNPRLCEEK